MRKLTSLFILCFLLSFGKVTAQEKSSVQEEKSSYTEEYDKFRFGGYGEMAASYKDYDFNAEIAETGEFAAKAEV